MALRFVDSFSHYSDPIYKWDQNDQFAIGVGNGRHGGNTLYNLSGSGGDTVTKIIDSQSGWTIGFAWYPTAHYGDNFLQFFDGATQHLYLQLNVTGKIDIYRGGGTLLGSGTKVFTPLQWYFIEFKFTIADAGGIAEVRWNGNVDQALSGLDTRNGGNASVDRLRFACNDTNSPTYYYGDLYVCDNTGGAPYDTFLGDSRVECIFPNGNGNSSQFDGSDGNTTDNYLLVDETTINDADYVESPDVGDKDTYAYGNLASTSGTVHGVAPVPRLRKTNAGSRTFVSVARLSGTETDSAARTVYDSFTYAQDIRTTKPGGGAWSITDVNNAEFGMKVNT